MNYRRNNKVVLLLDIPIASCDHWTDAEAVVERLNNLEGALHNACNTMAAQLKELQDLKQELALVKGAMNAQDERERAAGQLCGIPYEEHGCDWPDAVADALNVERKKRLEAEQDADALRQAIASDITNEAFMDEQTLCAYKRVRSK